MLDGARIVLVEGDHITGDSLTRRLELEGAEVVWLRHAMRALHAIRTPRGRVDAVVCDVHLPDGSGEEIFTTLCRTMTPPPFLFITAWGEIDEAVRLMRAGAADYVTKPFGMSAFVERLGQLIREHGDAMPEIFGSSEAAARIERGIRRAAATRHPVMIHGPPGTGKGQIARRIHALSDGAAAPFVEVKLTRDAEASDPLVGPDGGLARAGDGTLLLVTLESLSGPAQDTLHRALDCGFEGRVIVTSGLVSGSMIAAGDMRRDLLARLSQMEIPVPPLRERPEDAVWLLDSMFRRFAARDREATRPPLKGVSPLAEEAARTHDWPDNGRELKSRLRQAVRSAEGPWIQPADLFPEDRAEGHFPTLSEARDAAERRHIVAALERSEGRVSVAARLLKVGRTTLWEKMQKLGL